MSVALLICAAVAYAASFASAARADVEPDEEAAIGRVVDSAFFVGAALAFFLASILTLIVRVLS